jgi:hypothetical protein
MRRRYSRFIDRMLTGIEKGRSLRDALADAAAMTWEKYKQRSVRLAKAGRLLNMSDVSDYLTAQARLRGIVLPAELQAILAEIRG